MELFLFSLCGEWFHFGSISYVQGLNLWRTEICKREGRQTCDIQFGQQGASEASATAASLAAGKIRRKLRPWCNDIETVIKVKIIY